MRPDPVPPQKNLADSEKAARGQSAAERAEAQREYDAVAQAAAKAEAEETARRDNLSAARQSNYDATKAESTKRSDAHLAALDEKTNAKRDADLARWDKAAAERIKGWKEAKEKFPEFVEALQNPPPPPALPDRDEPPLRAGNPEQVLAWSYPELAEKIHEDRVEVATGIVEGYETLASFTPLGWLLDVYTLYSGKDLLGRDVGLWGRFFAGLGVFGGPVLELFGKGVGAAADLAVTGRQAARHADEVAEAGGRAADDVYDAAARDVADVFVKGRRAGTVVTDAALNVIERGLLRDGVVIKRNADQLLGSKNAGGMFRVFKDGSSTIFLRSNPTRYELLHELQHLEHLKQIGPTQYRKLARTVAGRLNLEQFVYDNLRKFHWDSLTAAERQHAKNYITSLHGNAW